MVALAAAVGRVALAALLLDLIRTLVAVVTIPPPTLALAVAVAQVQGQLAATGQAQRVVLVEQALHFQPLTQI
jgi:hypothetical protein